jgi:hypothetical protein
MKEYRQSAKRVAASDVVSLWREVYAEGVRERQDADSLIAFDRQYADPSPEWQTFFAAAIADHVLRRSVMPGVVTADAGIWLIGALAPSGHLTTPGALAALASIAEQARVLPASFAAFAIRKLWTRPAVSQDTAVAKPAHFMPALPSHEISKIQKVLKAAAGEGDAPVSAAEADALFDLHDTFAAKPMPATFDTLFFRAITNYLRGASGCYAPRTKALAREPARDAGHDISTGCRAWLYSRIMRDGRPTTAERLLLALVHGRAELKAGLGRLLHRAA